MRKYRLSIRTPWLIDVNKLNRICVLPFTAAGNKINPRPERSA